MFKRLKLQAAFPAKIAIFLYKNTIFKIACPIAGNHFMCRFVVYKLCSGNPFAFYQYVGECAVIKLKKKLLKKV